MRNLYLAIGMKLGWINLLTTQGTITFTAWNGRQRKFDNVKGFKFVPRQP